MNRDQRLNAEGEADADLTSYFALAVDRAARYYKLLLVLLGVFFLLVSANMHMATPLYSAVAALTPPKDSLSDSGTAAAGGITSITRRLGIGAQASGNFDLFDQYTRVLQSYRLAGALAKRPDFLALAFSTSWDPQTKKLKKPTGVTPAIIYGVKNVLGLPIVAASVEDMIYQLLETRLSISTPQGGNTNISEVSLRFDNPVAAQKLLDIILDEADSLMRTDKRRDIAARITYLQDQITKITLDDQRSAMISLLTIQQNTMMMIAADHHYASNVVEPPHAPGKPTWPNFVAVVGLILFLSFGSWGLAIFLLPANGRILARFSRDRTLIPWLKRGLGRVNAWVSGRRTSEHGRN